MRRWENRNVRFQQPNVSKVSPPAEDEEELKIA